MKRWPRYIVRMKKKQDTKQIHVCSVASVVSDSFRPYGLVAHQAPLSMGFYRLEYWSGLSCPPPGDLPNPGTEPAFPSLQVDSLLLSHYSGEGNGTLLQYSCLENPMDRGAW